MATLPKSRGRPLPVRPFSYKGKERRPGEAVPLCSQLVRVDGLWKLLKFDQ